MRVGFIGLGDQGEPMAEAIAEAGHELHVWARRPEVMAPFVERGAVGHASAAELAAEVEHLGLCVGSEADVRSVLFDGGVLEALPDGAVVAIHSTISPEACQRIAAEAPPYGVDVIDAPVSGGRRVAQERGLLVMVGGEEAPVSRAMPVLETYGNPVRHLGPIGSGQVVKVLNNLLMNANLTNSHLVLELGRHLGLDRAALRELLLHGTSRSFALSALDDQVIPGKLSAVTGRKDLAVARQFIDGAGSPVDLLDQVVAIALEVREHLDGSLSSTAARS
ncbi:NAD(P)-dependent oxidoreductase [Georgenia sp. AZ-5]|uniref:NAD(P)-dependent oxidoreductase n=1 Tax=Georgenia sp. AZ-5 TaxID=3367526 RepID=UPI0037545E60